MLGEFDLIAKYFAPLAADAPGALGLTDDAALLSPPPGCDLVLAADALIEGVHFLPEDPADLVARKLLRVNLSDLAAMGAAPLGYLVTAAWPRERDEAWIAAFAEGLGRDQETFSISLLGGDTTASPGPVALSLTALGAVPAGGGLRRGTARAGDLLFVSGSLGEAALGLLALRGELAHASSEDRDALAARYRLPEPRLALGAALLETGLASAAIDVSDGLVADAEHIAETSALAAHIEWPRLPLSLAVERALAAAPELRAQVLTGGDDYELCFSAPPARAEDVAGLAERLGLALTRVGELRAGKGVRVVDEAGAEIALEAAGWTHF